MTSLNRKDDTSDRNNALKEQQQVDALRETVEGMWHRAKAYEKSGAGTNAVEKYEQALEVVTKAIRDFPNSPILASLKRDSKRKLYQAKENWIGIPTLILDKKGKELVRLYERFKKRGRKRVEFFNENGEFVGIYPIDDCVKVYKELAIEWGDGERLMYKANKNSESKRRLNVFLCHASQDKPIVREIYHRLLSEVWIDPWLDEEKLLPGQDWGMEIEKAIEETDVIIVFVSSNSVTKEGYLQREIRFAWDIALEKPEETIFIIPLRLDECEPPRRLRGWQYADYFPENIKTNSYQRILESLKKRAAHLNLAIEQTDLRKDSVRNSPGLGTGMVTFDENIDRFFIGNTPIAEEIPGMPKKLLKYLIKHPNRFLRYEEISSQAYNFSEVYYQLAPQSATSTVQRSKKKLENLLNRENPHLEYFEKHQDGFIFLNPPRLRK